MTRYYYTDPLAAAWMAQKFGMRFLINGSEFTQEIAREPSNDWGMANLYIHPGSLALLEPQVDDLVTVNGGQDAHIAFHQDFIDALKANYTRFAGPIRIIQRNDIAFMWPEVEP